MKKLICFAFCISLLNSLLSYANSNVIIPSRGTAFWIEDTAIANLPMLQEGGSYDIVQGDFYTIYTQNGIAYKVEISYAAWSINGRPSFITITYQDGKTTVINIKDKPNTGGGDGSGDNHTVYLQYYE